MGCRERDVVGNVEVIAFCAERVGFGLWSKARFGKDKVTFLWFSTDDGEIFSYEGGVVLEKTSGSGCELLLLHQHLAQNCQILVQVTRLCQR